MISRKICAADKFSHFAFWNLFKNVMSISDDCVSVHELILSFEDNRYNAEATNT